jgi:hypothetical protein
MISPPWPTSDSSEGPTGPPETTTITRSGASSHAEPSEGEAEHDVGWLRRLWGKYSRTPPEPLARKKTATNLVPVPVPGVKNDMEQGLKPSHSAGQVR